MTNPYRAHRVAVGYSVNPDGITIQFRYVNPVAWPAGVANETPLLDMHPHLARDLIARLEANLAMLG